MNASTFILNEASDDKKSQSLTSQDSTIQCNVSPLVIMSILNHYQRRPSNKQSSRQQSQPKIAYPSFVIGLLFGHKDKATNTLLINDTFGLEMQLDPEKNAVAVNQDNAIKALQLHATAHPNDRFVGWYRTGLTIDTHTTAIYEHVMLKLVSLSNKISKKAGPELDDSEYIHLLVDTALKNDKLSIKTYTSIAVNDPLQEQEYQDYLKEKKRREKMAKQRQQNPNSKSSKQRKRRKKKQQQQQQGQKQEDASATSLKSVSSTGDDSKLSSPQQAPKQQESTTKSAEVPEEPLVEVEKPYAIFYRFHEITCNYLASESEKIGLDMIIESPPEGAALDSPSMLLNDTNHLENVLQLLLQNLESVEEYVHQVINGQIDGDESIGWLMGDALSSVPNLSPQKFEQMISNRLQDFLMMEYLAKMTKAQLVIADKINQVLPCTVPGYEAGAEK